VILTRKRSQGIAIANYLTEQNIPLLSSETLMIQNATEVDYSSLKYLKNNADLEAKLISCIISLKIFRINCLFMILLQRNGTKIGSRF
jgi:hypothetical protein